LVGRQAAQQQLAHQLVVGCVGKAEAVQVANEVEESHRQLDAGGDAQAALTREHLVHMRPLEPQHLVVVAGRIPRQRAAVQLQQHVHERPEVVAPRELLVLVGVHRGVAARAAELGR
jgi:hypothetical protein